MKITEEKSPEKMSAVCPGAPKKKHAATSKIAMLLDEARRGVISPNQVKEVRVKGSLLLRSFRKARRQMSAPDASKLVSLLEDLQKVRHTRELLKAREHRGTCLACHLDNLSIQEPGVKGDKRAAEEREDEPLKKKQKVDIWARRK